MSEGWTFACPSGRKVFLAQYRVGGGRKGRQRRVKLGVYGTITADEARIKAREILANLPSVFDLLSRLPDGRDAYGNSQEECDRCEWNFHHVSI